MARISTFRRTQFASWALGLAVISAVGAVLCGGLISVGVPPASYIYLAIYLLATLPALILGILGLKSSSKKQAISALAIAAAACLFFIPFAAAGFRNTPLKVSLKQIEKAVGSACSGQAIPGTSPYIPGPGRHPLVAFNPAEFSPVSFGWIPRKYWPTELSEVEFVLCVSAEYDEMLDGCSYRDGTFKNRFQIKRDVQLISTYTGETIAQGTIEGSLPKECPDLTEQGNSADINGKKPDILFEATKWLEDVLAQ